MFRTNYFGAVNSAEIALDVLRDGGALITVGSIASQLPSPILGAYAASKHAVKAYVDALRMELTAAGTPISVTLIVPSGIDTPIGRHAANHVDGEALVPPPVYDPDLVATAILDAAVNRRREVTVGGMGRAQVLLATHFPRLLDHAARVVAPKLSDPGRPKTSADSLFAPSADGDERSGIDPGRRFSLYTAAARHPAVVAAVVTALALGTAVGLRRRGGRSRG